MTRWKPVTSKIVGDPIISIQTETGHIIKVKLTSKVSIDIDADEDGLPYFFINVPADYKGVE